MTKDNKSKKKTESILAVDISEKSKSRFRYLGLALLVILLATVSTSFATADNARKDKTSKANEIKAGAGCSQKITFILDRSTSIGAPSNGGNNINSIKSAVEYTTQYLYDKNGAFESDLITFATKAIRINTGGWWNNSDQNKVEWQRALAFGIDYKSIAYTDYKGNYHPNTLNSNFYTDGYDHDSEGLTNWDDALAQVSRQAAYIGYPDAVIMFTDGNPTTYNGDPDNVNGTFRNGTATDTSFADVAQGVIEADKLRAKGVDVIPIGIGTGVNAGNLSSLGAGTYYYGTGYDKLLGFMLAASDKIQAGCTPTPTTTTKPPAPKTSTLGVRAYNADTGALMPNVKFNSSTPFAGTYDSGSSGNFTYKTTTTGSNWKFTTSYLSGAPAHYVVDSVVCRNGAWSTSSPVVGTTNSKSGVSTGSFAPGTSIRCEYKFKDSRKSITPGLQITLSTPSPNAIYEIGNGTSVVNVSAKNTGNITLTNIRLTQGNALCATTLAPGASTQCPNYIYSAPGLGAPNPAPVNVSASGTVTINPATEKFANLPATFTPNGANSGTITANSSVPITIMRIKLPV